MLIEHSTCPQINFRHIAIQKEILEIYYIRNFILPASLKKNKKKIKKKKFWNIVEVAFNTINHQPKTTTNQIVCRFKGIYDWRIKPGKYFFQLKKNWNTVENGIIYHKPPTMDHHYILICSFKDIYDSQIKPGKFQFHFSTDNQLYSNLI